MEERDRALDALKELELDHRTGQGVGRGLPRARRAAAGRGCPGDEGSRLTQREGSRRDRRTTPHGPPCGSRARARRGRGCAGRCGHDRRAKQSVDAQIAALGDAGGDDAAPGGFASRAGRVGIVGDPRARAARQRHLGRARAARARARAAPRAAAPAERALPAPDGATEAPAAAARDRAAPPRGSRRSSLYRQEQTDTLSLLLSSTSFTDALDMFDYLRRIADEDKHIANEVGAAKKRSAGAARGDEDDAQAPSPGDAGRRRARRPDSRPARPARRLPQRSRRRAGRAPGRISPSCRPPSASSSRRWRRSSR